MKVNSDRLLRFRCLQPMPRLSVAMKRQIDPFTALAAAPRVPAHIILLALAIIDGRQEFIAYTPSSSCIHSGSGLPRR
jgi:hypothetical protein